MWLEIDAGNSRLKWRLRKPAAAGLVPMQALAGQGAGELGQALLAELSAVADEKPERIMLASVRGAAFDQALTQCLEQALGVQVELARVRALHRGLQVAYAEPARLGVDRWLALLAAHADYPGGCCVLDCGTTITLDFLAAQGRHEGGFIVPGLGLLRETLARRAPALDVPAAATAGREPGCDTSSAIINGNLNLVLGFLEDQRQRLAARGDQRPWVLTGGDARQLASGLVQWQVDLRPQLVLDGLPLACS